MARIYRPRPPRVGQALTNRCWAAVLESGSKIDRRIPQQEERTLVARYGEGPTGGISPGQKIPQLARRFGLRHGGLPGDALDGYAGTNVHVMDPRGPSHRARTVAWLTARAPFAMMRR